MFLVGIGLLGGAVVTLGVVGSAASARSTPLIEPRELELGRQARIDLRAHERVAIEVSVDVRFEDDLELEPGFSPMPACRFPMTLEVTDSSGHAVLSASAVLAPGSPRVNALQPIDSPARNVLRLVWLGDPFFVPQDAPLVARVRVADGPAGGGRVERVVLRANEPPVPHGGALAWVCLPCSLVPVGLFMFGAGMRRARARGRARELLPPAAPEADSM